MGVRKFELFSPLFLMKHLLWSFRLISTPITFSSKHALFNKIFLPDCTFLLGLLFSSKSRFWLLASTKTSLNRFYLFPLLLLEKKLVWFRIYLSQFVFAVPFSIEISIVDFFKLNEHFRSSFNVLLELIFLHIFTFALTVHTILTHLITLISLCYWRRSL